MTRLAGEFTVDLPPAEAFRLFTPLGERDWAAGWEPEFQANPDDDAAPGTVFRTFAHGLATTWVVTGREEPRLISYAQFWPEHRAGTITVILDERAGASLVTVVYHLTPLSETARPALARFAAGYPEFLDSWRDAIERWLRERRST